MRVINCLTKQFEEFFNEEVSAYAIPSHIWEGHEIPYRDHHEDEAGQYA
jgi:hypothetical protein